MNITSILKQYKIQCSITIFLVLLEALIILFFPLFIGFAIEDALNSSKDGAFKLGFLGISALIVGFIRRFFDSRFYAKVFREKGFEMLSKIKNKKTSVKAARLDMLKELIEFMENSLPELIANIIGLLGVIVIIASLNFKVFIGCIVSSFFISVIYLLTSNYTTRLNKNYNNEIEKQVDKISSTNDLDAKKHLKNIMKWNIKLSDLEAINFSFSWAILIIFLIFSIVFPIYDGILKYGKLFSLVMYAFQYIENVINLPFYFQNWIRLKEISKRLKE